MSRLLVNLLLFEVALLGEESLKAATKRNKAYIFECGRGDVNAVFSAYLVTILKLKKNNIKNGKHCLFIQLNIVQFYGLFI